MDSTTLIVGFPYRSEKEYDEKYEKFGKKNGSDCKSFIHQCFALDHIHFYGAGYEHRTKGTPHGVMGIAIISTWNDAIEITEGHFRKIEKAKKILKEKVGEEPKLFIIGHQN